MTKSVRFDIPLLLPDVSDTADKCVARLQAVMDATDGVDKAHILEASGDQPSLLCVHYNPEMLSLAAVRQVVKAAGAGISSRIGHYVRDLGGSVHARKARTIDAKLAAVPGIIEAAIVGTGIVRVEFDRTLTNEVRIDRFLDGFGSLPEPATVKQPKNDDHEGHDHKGQGEDHNHEHGGPLGQWTEPAFAIGCGVALGIGFAIEQAVPSAPGWLPLALYFLSYALGGFFTVREAVENLRLKRFEIDTLMLVAAAGAAALGAWAEGALLLFLFSIGHALEHYAMGRAKKAIEALSELAPKTALVRRDDGTITYIPVEELAIGDTVIVKPDERIAADGFITKGTTVVNQAPVTGESIPVDSLSNGVRIRRAFAAPYPLAALAD